ncbi:MAG: sugar nucleotide-binding protein, partial [Alcaligenaceae bacterium]|nr:sugar nucleotide-binding protein [Alcaligenaceae bacterium]
ESAPTGPVNYYGYSKLAGERLIANSGCAHLVFCTSWVYGTQGNNFAKTMMRLAQEKEELSIVGDQVGVPTGADLIADVTAHAIRSYLQGMPGMAREDLSGIYHLVPDGETSWFEYASLVFGQLRKKGVPLALKQAHAVATEQYPTPAKRPLNSRLCNQKIKDVFALHLPGWEPGVCRLLDEIVA